MGDLPGVRARLPYLRDLGVDAVWLTPFYASPQADAGYDVADYRAVDPMFGDLDDAEALIARRARAGLRVIVDLVPNHTSDQHEWFRRGAGGAGPGSAAREPLPLPRRARASTANCRPTTGSRSSAARPGPGRRTPTARRASGTCTCSPPSSPTSTGTTRRCATSSESVLRFWLDLGVDGFRIDVAHGLVKAAGLPDVGTPSRSRCSATQSCRTSTRTACTRSTAPGGRMLDSYPGERIAVAEAWAPTVERLAALRAPRRAAPGVQLPVPGHALGTRGAARGDRRLAGRRRLGRRPATWVLSNHDVEPARHPLRRRRSSACAGPAPRRC